MNADVSLIKIDGTHYDLLCGDVSLGCICVLHPTPGGANMWFAGDVATSFSLEVALAKLLAHRADVIAKKLTRGAQ
jgi:hypothetical protein